jgi:flavoprotein
MRGCERARDGARIAWAVTGAGHFLRESVDAMASLREAAAVDAFLSLAAVEVVGMYGLRSGLENAATSVTVESGHSFPVTSKFSAGRYGALVIAPATGNTVAKCAVGIADSLVSCMFAQAGKSRVPIIVLPTDVSGEITSIAPNGNAVMVYPRPLDLDLTRRLRGMNGVEVLSSPDELRVCLERMLKTGFVW